MYSSCSFTSLAVKELRRSYALSKYNQLGILKSKKSSAILHQTPALNNGTDRTNKKNTYTTS